MRCGEAMFNDNIFINYKFTLFVDLLREPHKSECLRFYSASFGTRKTRFSHLA